MQELVKSGLKPNAELFCQYFAETRNATQSYKKAYAKNRPTNKSCAVLGHKLLRSIKVRHRIEALMGDIVLDSHIKPIQVLNEFADLAFANLADMVNEDFSLKKLSKLTPGQRKAIKKLKITTNKRFNKEGETIGEKVIVEVELHDRMKALEALAHYTGILKPEIMQQIFLNVKSETNNTLVVNPDDLPVEALEKLIEANSAAVVINEEPKNE